MWQHAALPDRGCLERPNNGLPVYSAIGGIEPIQKGILSFFIFDPAMAGANGLNLVSCEPFAAGSWGKAY